MFFRPLKTGDILESFVVKFHVPILLQEASPDEKTLQDLGAAATAVTKALNDLLQHIKKGTGDREVGVALVDCLYETK